MKNGASDDHGISTKIAERELRGEGWLGDQLREMAAR